MAQYEVRFVDAIEEGKIVKVPEDYARREGLMILRRQEIQPARESNEYKRLQSERKEKDFFSIDKFRKPLKNKNNVLASLVDNFHWQISTRRREKNLTRKQVALALGVREIEIKMIENGVLPSDDFVLINKIQSYYGINLRKDGQDFTTSMRDVVEGKAEIQDSKSEENEKASDISEEESEMDEMLSGSDIEIVDEK